MTRAGCWQDVPATVSSLRIRDLVDLVPSPECIYKTSFQSPHLKCVMRNLAVAFSSISHLFFVLFKVGMSDKNRPIFPVLISDHVVLAFSIDNKNR